MGESELEINSAGGSEGDGKDSARREAAAVRGAKKRALIRTQAVQEAQNEAAMWFKALGDPTRLRIYDILRENRFGIDISSQESPINDSLNTEPVENERVENKGKIKKSDKTAKADKVVTNESLDGLTVGAVAEGLFGAGDHKNAASTVSHHLKELRHAGLISMKRQGKNIVCRIEEEAATRLAGYLCSMPPAVKIK